MCTSRDPKNHTPHPCINIRDKKFSTPHHQQSQILETSPSMTLGPPMRRILKPGGGGKVYISRSEKSPSHPCIKIRDKKLSTPHHQRSQILETSPSMTLGPPMRRVLKPGGGGNLYISRSEKSPFPPMCLH